MPSATGSQGPATEAQLATLRAERDAWRDRCARLECALTPFAEIASLYPSHPDNLRLLAGFGGCEILMQDLREAQRVLRDRRPD